MRTMKENTNMRTKALERKFRTLAESILFESSVQDPGPTPGYVQYGMHDRPVTSNPMTTTPVPVDPLASQESLLNLPPIDDPDYFPTTVHDLSLALYAVAQSVPQNHVATLFRAVKRKVDEMKTKVTIAESKGGGYWGEDDEDDWDDLDDLEKGAAARYKASTDKSKQEDDFTYDDLAKQMGFSSASAARNIEIRTMTRLKYILDNISIDAYEALQDDAVESFALGMKDLGMIDASDVADLLSSPKSVKSLPSFKYYFNNAYVMPAYRELKEKASERVSDMLSSLGVDDQMRDFLLSTTINQIAGESKVNHDVILKKLLKGNPSDKFPAKPVDPAKAQAIHKKYVSMWPKFVAAAELDSQLVELARVLQNKKSKSVVAKDIKDALSKAGDDYGDE
jgi:hypothetical protein